MYTYIQIIGKDSKTFKGYVVYKMNGGQLSMTLIRGMRSLQHINIPCSEVTDLSIDKFYGEDRINFVYQEKKYSFIYTGYGEAQDLEHKLFKTLNA